YLFLMFHGGSTEAIYLFLPTRPDMYSLQSGNYHVLSSVLIDVLAQPAKEIHEILACLYPPSKLNAQHILPLFMFISLMFSIPNQCNICQAPIGFERIRFKAEAAVLLGSLEHFHG
ncbi:hypothetical protein ACJX0J_010659, partial [Zea mays]